MNTPNKSSNTLCIGRQRATSWLARTGTGLIVLALVFGFQISARAQSDNFDSYSTTAQLQGAGWILSSLNPALVSTTFPVVGSGKGLRIQANPVPDAAPAVGMWYRTNEYTDFYVAVDIANWPGTDKNQAMVLFARMTDQTGVVVANQNPATAQGIICNYDASQYGENPGNRRQGQFQINIVSPGFSTVTLAVTEITFIPGRSYRIIFKGVGTTFTAQAYDLNDLTAPLVTLQATDPGSGFAFGACGILSFSRQGTTGTADATFDNYYAGATDPNPAPAPALAHPIAGTPAVVTRAPSARWKNLLNPALPITFTANTFSANVINASATKFLLNGIDVSSQLTLSANGTSINGSLPASALQPNQVYSAEIWVTDVAGTKGSLNTFWFDTYSDAFLESIKTIEVEDYNYSNGVYQLDPIAVSGLDVNSSQVNGAMLNDLGYFKMTGTPDVDFYKPAGFYSFGIAEYRENDRVQITQGSTYSPFGDDESADIQDDLHGVPHRIHDTQRAKYLATNVWEYQVRLTSPGDWMNYTRVFEPTNYYVFLRCATFGATTVFLDRVTSDPTIEGQTTAPLGAFNIENHIQRLNYRYVPLTVGAGGCPAVVSLSSTNTLRLTVGGVTGEHDRRLVMDYLVFVPTSLGPTIVDNFNDGEDTNPPWDHYDPIGGLTAPPATFAVTGGVYHIIAPAPLAPDAGQARAGSFLRDAIYTDFYVAADLIDFDDTVRQAFGIAARVNTPGIGTTGGYLFSWEPGGGTLPGTDNGDLDISPLVQEVPIGQIETEPSGLHLERGKSYRFVFMGSGFNFEGQVYEYPDLANPLIRLPAVDPNELYPSGAVGLISASQGDLTIAGDATWDNFLATTAEPRIAFVKAGSNVILSWPELPFRLQSSPTLSAPVWTDITTGIGHADGKCNYTTSTSASQYFRLVYP